MSAMMMGEQDGGGGGDDDQDSFMGAIVDDYGKEEMGGGEFKMQTSLQK